MFFTTRDPRTLLQARLDGDARQAREPQSCAEPDFSEAHTESTTSSGDTQRPLIGSTTTRHTASATTMRFSTSHNPSR